MSKMYEWAKHEVELLNHSDCYDQLCYKSALKALKSLDDDGHSGYSIIVTKAILDRLIIGKPLSEITEENAEWRFSYEDDKAKHYQSKRCSSLFKDVYSDGRVEYDDTQAFIAFDPDDSSGGYYRGSSCAIGREIFPITLPYYPLSEPYKIAVKDLGDEETDIRLYEYIIKPDGTKIEINKCYQYDKNGNRTEIDNKFQTT